MGQCKWDVREFGCICFLSSFCAVWLIVSIDYESGIKIDWSLTKSVLFLVQTYQEEDLHQAAIHLLHFALPPRSLPLCLDYLANL